MRCFDPSSRHLGEVSSLPHTPTCSVIIAGWVTRKNSWSNHSGLTRPTQAASRIAWLFFHSQSVRTYTRTQDLGVCALEDNSGRAVDAISHAHTHTHTHIYKWPLWPRTEHDNATHGRSWLINEGFRCVVHPLHIHTHAYTPFTSKGHSLFRHKHWGVCRHSERIVWCLGPLLTTMMGHMKLSKCALWLLASFLVWEVILSNHSSQLTGIFNFSRAFVTVMWSVEGGDRALSVPLTVHLRE